MMLYFDFEGTRRRAEVQLPGGRGDIKVELSDKDLLKHFPPDLVFEVNERNKVDFILEDKSNKRLSELQYVIAYRLQEFVNKS